jgi:hypothetical protein
MIQKFFASGEMLLFNSLAVETTKKWNRVLEQFEEYFTAFLFPNSEPGVFQFSIDKESLVVLEINFRIH